MISLMSHRRRTRFMPLTFRTHLVNGTRQAEHAPARHVTSASPCAIPGQAAKFSLANHQIAIAKAAADLMFVADLMFWGPMDLVSERLSTLGRE
jgi:hypothetical protein